MLGETDGEGLMLINNVDEEEVSGAYANYKKRVRNGFYW